MNSIKVHEQKRLEQGVGFEMSPVVPVLGHRFVQAQDNCSESDKSEVLIPLVTAFIHPRTTEVNPNNKQHEEDSEMPEESQSLLPQLPGEACTLTLSHNECLSSSSCSQTVQDFPMLSQNLVKEDQKTVWPTKMCPISGKSQKSNLSSALKKGQQSLQTDLRQSKRSMKIFSDVSMRPKRDTQGGKVTETNEIPRECIDENTSVMSQDLDIVWPQKQVSSTEDIDNITFSQISLSHCVAAETDGEIVYSQREITPTQAEKVSSKIEGLVASLDKVSRKQMLVSEATLLQCISQLQDSLHKKLKREKYMHHNIDTYRQLLLTCQTALAKLSQLHKTERIALNQSGCTQIIPSITTGLSQAQKQSVCVEALKDLGKRQKRVLTLLKRQRCLVDLLKAMKRSLHGHDIDKRKEATRVESTYRTQNTEVTVKPGSSNVAEPHYPTHKSGSSRDGSQSFGQVSEQRCQSKEVQQTMQQLKKSENIRQSNNTTLREAEQIVSGLNIDKTDTCKVASDTVEDTDGPMGCSQRYNTQDTTRTSGIDLFDDADGDDVESTAYTIDGNTCSDREKFSQVSDIVNIRNEMESVDDKFDSNVSFGLRQKSVLDSKNEQRSEEHKHHMIEENAHRTKSHETHTAIELKAQVVDKFNANAASLKGPNRDNEFKNSEKLLITSRGDANDDDGSVSVDKSQNVTVNHLKRKIDVDSGNDIDNMKTKRTELVDAGKDTLELVAHSEVLWLNMLRNDSDKTKPGTCFKAQESELLCNHENPVVGPEKKDSEKSSSDTHAFASANTMNLNKQRSYVAVDNTRTCGGHNRRSGKHYVAAQTIDVHDKSEEIVNDSDNEDYNSPKVCSPLSLAVRGSPCETLNNVSPNGSTVCSEVFMLKTKQFDAQKKEYLDSAHGARMFGNTSNQKENISFNKSGNQNVDPWIKSTRFDQLTKPQIVEVQKSSTCASGNITIKSTENITKNKQENNVKKSVEVTGSVSEAINLVIQRSRDTGQGGYMAGGKKSGKQKQSTLLSLKELVQSGILTPGKYVLSCTLKGVLHKASLTQFGKIRTTDSHTFNTVSSWLSTLSEGVGFKKRKAYDMTLYKGRSLLSYCKETEISSNLHTAVTLSCNPMTDCSTQVDASEFSLQDSRMTEDEIWLNNLLSTSRVRLLSDKDLVSNHDLPDNFWTEDFSKVRLSSDIWNCVIAW